MPKNGPNKLKFGPYMYFYRFYQIPEDFWKMLKICRFLAKNRSFSACFASWYCAPCFYEKRLKKNCRKNVFQRHWFSKSIQSILLEKQCFRNTFFRQFFFRTFFVKKWAQNRDAKYAQNDLFWPKIGKFLEFCKNLQGFDKTHRNTCLVQISAHLKHF